MKTKMRYRLLYFAPVLCLFVVLGLNLQTSLAYAAVTPVAGGGDDGTWDDHNTISYDGQVYVDGKTDSTLNFQYSGATCSLKGLSTVDSSITVKSSDLSTGVLYAPSADNSTCTFTNISLGNTQAASIYFKWSDGTTITTSDGRRDYPLNGTEYIETKDAVDSGEGCHDSLTVTSTDATTATLIMRSTNKSPNAASYPPGTVGNSTVSSGQVNGCYSFTSAVQIVPLSTTVSSTTGTSSSGDCSKLVASTSDPNASEDSADCEEKCVSSNDLGWFLCKIYDGVGDASNWVFTTVIAPWLHEPPISIDPGTSSYQAWSNFRLYGDVFLVIALLAIVFGESIGGGLLDAYTVKKVLPRLLIAAILINLSIYLVAALVDISNVLGGGIGDLLTKGSTGAFHISLDGTSAGTIGGVSAGTGIGVALFATLVSGGAGILASGLAYIGVLVISAIFFGLLAMFLTLIIRQAAILILVLISPIAFALYCLPNTEQYFKRWWDLLLELLLMYPIIVIILSAADLLSVAVDTNYSTGNPNGALVRPFISFLLQFLPLFFIPYAFRLASKTVGRVHEVINGVAMQGHERTGKKMAQQFRQNTSDKSIALRERTYTSLQETGSKEVTGFKSRLKRRGARILAAPVGGYNLDAQISAIQAQRNKEVNDVIATGKDGQIRGLTVDKATSESHIDKEGKVQYKSLGGTWIDEADVDRAYSRWGNDKYAQQAALSYEMRKAQSEEQLQNLGTNYHNVTRAWGMSDSQAGGAWIGAAFENQNQHLEYKSVDWKTGALKRDEKGIVGGGLVDEMYEKRGSYQVSQMSSNTIEQLKQAHQLATATGDTETQQKIAAISETFMHQMGGQIGVGENDQPILNPGGGATAIDPATGQPRRQVSTQGAAHVAERVYELASMTGRRITPPSNPYPPDSPQS